MCCKSLPFQWAVDNKLAANICLDTIDSQQEMTTLPCFDMFHKECILSWLKQKLVCPLHTNDLLS